MARIGELLDQAIRETRRLDAASRLRARGRGATAKLKAAGELEDLADRCETVSRKIKQRVGGEPIPDRLVPRSDPDARPIRKGKLGNPTNSGMSRSSRRSPRTPGVVRVACSTRPRRRPANPGENTLLPQTVAELQKLGLDPREIALDAGFHTNLTTQARGGLTPERLFITGRQ